MRYKANFYHILIYVGVACGFISAAVTAATGGAPLVFFISLSLSALLILTLRVTDNTRRANSELESQNQALTQYNKMKSEFLSAVAHEINTPLAVISASSRDTLDLLEESGTHINGAGVRGESTGSAEAGGAGEDSAEAGGAGASGSGAGGEKNLVTVADEIKENQYVIEKRVKMISGILTDLMDVAAIESGRLKLKLINASLASLLKEVCDAQFAHLNVNGNQLKYDLEQALPPIYIDARRIEQVLTNLLSNAVRHTRGGVVTISLKQTGDVDGDYVSSGKVGGNYGGSFSVGGAVGEGGSFGVGSEDGEGGESGSIGVGGEGGNCIRQIVSVTDTGEGMDICNAEAALADNFTTKADYWRHGIGLSVCKRIIEAHGGEFIIKSEKGRGASVSFILSSNLSCEKERQLLVG